MKLNILKAGSAAALLVGSTLISATSVASVDEAVEANSAGYVGAGGFVVKTGDGCLKTGALTEDNQINVCEGIEEVAEAPAAEPEATEEMKAPEPEPTIIPVSRSVTAEFATGSAELSAEGEAEISAMIAELSAMPEIVSIDIAGHTDSRGTEANNQVLSEARAETVRGKLAAAFPNALITAKGFGESQPIASNADAAGRAENRRVDVNVKARTVEN